MLRDLVLLSLAASSLALHLPSYIKPCKKDDANFNECVKNHAIEAIPSIINGDKEFKVAPLDPFTVPEITLDAGNQLSIKLTDVVLKGLSGVQVEDIIIDFEKKHIYTKFHLKSLSIDGQYNIDGKILVVPIQGSGPFHLKCEDFVTEYSFTYKLMTKDGEEYFDPDISPKTTYKVEKIDLKLENLFNGDKALGDKTNEFINENIYELNNEFSATFVEAINSVVTMVIKQILPMVPFKEVFP